MLDLGYIISKKLLQNEIMQFARYLGYIMPNSLISDKIL